ncbi:Receptor-like protein kinase [Quillaja saponaria]|uniref:non-specific serine/threonine protein kinase n=1 Tax=Quillaja saponaria TaxID=32244 RepID=A0AAD7KXW0_QUISA|nr:Receptor-like protein kinase [Quillaja saponaria]
MQGLYLTKNKLDGRIPDEICQLENLVELTLSNNKLSGPVPSCVGMLTSLRILYLDSNNFTFKILSTLWALENILELDFSLNAFDGYLPLEIQNLTVVRRLDLSWNRFSGTIPSKIGGLQSLEFLYLEHNHLQGCIPESIGGMLSIRFLDMSHKILSGLIPTSLELLIYMEYFNVSYNKLQGEIPDGESFVNFTAQSFMMNDALCGRPDLQVPPCEKGDKKRWTTRLLLLECIVPIIVSAILLGSCVMLLHCRRKNTGDTTENEISTLGVPRRVSYYELLQSTNRFDHSNLLGIGSFGSVFKGRLSNGMLIAVKVFDLDLELGPRSFDVECDAMRMLRHRNLIKIISSCSNVDFKALVMEFMPNGSLEKWLYSHNCSLDFQQRFDIMIDVASALEYLHHGFPTPVVHCDLKRSNILLDEDMVAHVADFGIAKLLDKGQSTTHTNTLATLGYIAPEYGAKGIVSTKGDVYSFGIMLMEIFTRMKPTDDMFGGELSLKSWVNESVPHSTIQVLDSNLLKREEQNFSAKELSTSSIMELALNCCADLPEERINMKDALVSLKKIRTKFMEMLLGDWVQAREGWVS